MTVRYSTAHEWLLLYALLGLRLTAGYGRSGPNPLYRAANTARLERGKCGSLNVAQLLPSYSSPVDSFSLAQVER